MYTKESKKTFTFHTVEFTVQNYRGLYNMGDKVRGMIHALSVEDAQKVNKAAWKEVNAAKYIANRHNNWSISGNIETYEEATAMYSVASQVAKESWKRMKGY